MLKNMYTHWRCACLIAFVITGSAIIDGSRTHASAQHQQQSAPSTTAPAPFSGVKLGGVGLRDKTLTLDDLKNLPRESVEVEEKDGAKTIWQGVHMADVLAAAGMQFGKNLRGQRLSDYLIAQSGDGFRVVFALTEFDREFSDRPVILADTRNGAAIDGRDGPLRLIVTGERKHARWVRNVTSLTIHSAPLAN